MKNKNNVRPPSKSEDGENREITRLQLDYLSARSKFYKAASEQQAKKSFENLVEIVSSDLNLDKQGLREAYKDNPSELKKKFSNIAAYENDAVDRLGRMGPAMVIFSSISAFAAAAGSEAALLFGTFAAVFGLGGVFAANSGIKALKNKKKAKEEIVTKALEYSDHKKLPAPK
jgi:hypothetical protein